MTLAIRLCVCIRSQYDAVHMPGKPSVMSDSGNILVTMTNTQEPQNTNTSGALAVAKATAGLKLYDTASHAVSSFTPIKPGQVGIYVCGATVQSSPHIGHIRTTSNATAARICPICGELKLQLLHDDAFSSDGGIATVKG